MTVPAPPLDGLRVVDLSTWIAGAYCTKLLADGGAEVVKVEPPAGDPLRRWSASGALVPDGDDGALFDFLAASKQSVVVDVGDDDQLASLRPLLAAADAVVWSRGSEVAEHPELAPAELLRAHPHLIVTAITPFGLDGPWHDRPATEFTVQALVGRHRRASPGGGPTRARSTSAVRWASGSPAPSPPSGPSRRTGAATRPASSSTCRCWRRRRSA